MTLRFRIAIFLLGTSALANIYSTQPLLTTIGGDFGVPATDVAWTVSATTLGVALTAPLAGSVSDVLGRRRVMAAALAGSCLTTLGCAFAGTFTVLLVLRAVQGIWIPFVFAVVVAYIAEEVPANRSATVNALYVSGTAFGGFCGRFLPGLTVSALGWRASFVVLAGLAAVVLAATVFWLPREREFRRAESLWSSLRGMGRHLTRPDLLATCLIGAAILFLQVGSLTYAGLYLEGPPFGFSPVQVGAVFLVFLVAVVVTPATGRLIARIGRLRTYLASSVLSLAGLGLTLVPSAGPVVAGLAGSSTSVFAGQACATGHVAETSPVSRSSAVGLYLMSYYLGGSIGAVAPAAVYVTGGWGATVALLCAVVVLSTLVAVAAWRPGGRSGGEHLT